MAASAFKSLHVSVSSLGQSVTFKSGSLLVHTVGNVLVSPSISMTSAAEMSGSIDLSSATTPVTNGAAYEVPASAWYPGVVLSCLDTLTAQTLVPGAAMVMAGP